LHCLAREPSLAYFYAHLGNRVLYGFYFKNGLEDRHHLDMAIVLLERSLYMLQSSDQFHPTILLALGRMLIRRSYLDSSLTDAEKAERLAHRAIPLQQPSSMERWLSLYVLACSSYARYRRVGKRVDLDETVLYCRKSLTLTMDNQSRATVLAVLNSSLMDARDPKDVRILTEALKY
jgi:hypothetical protein